MVLPAGGRGAESVESVAVHRRVVAVQVCTAASLQTCCSPPAPHSVPHTQVAGCQVRRSCRTPHRGARPLPPYLCHQGTPPPVGGGGGKRGRKMTAIFHITYAIQMRRCLIHQRHVEGMHGGGGLLGRYMATISFPPSSPISVLSQRMAPFFVAECIACSHTACVHTAFIHTISPHTSSPAQSAPKNTHVPPPPSHLSSSLCTAYPAPFPCIPPSAEHAPPPPCFAPAHRMMMRRGRPGWRSWRGCL